MKKTIAVLWLAITLFGCGDSSKESILEAENLDYKNELNGDEDGTKQTELPDSLGFVSVLANNTSKKMHNLEAVIPPQCYTKTEQKHNPCYTCHQSHTYGTRPNLMQDAALQGDYGFSDVGLQNRWDNLFIDRTAEIAAISDERILEYVAQDNYSKLKGRLEAQGWEGYLPDLENLHLAADAFEADGFAKDGSGWVAFNYKLLPSTFWPTNGSTDDVFIRLPEKFRTDSAGDYSKTIYQANLAIVEAAIKELDSISVVAFDENIAGIDLNGDGIQGSVDNIKRPSNYLGAASTVEVVPFLYPEGVEFLHTVRYVGVKDNGEIYVPQRMKELRYMRKIRFFTGPKLASLYGNEKQEKIDENLPKYPDAGDWGLDNKFGWQISGFIENAEGELRVQNYEENFFCMGCHTSIGATIDQTFAFPRKVTGVKGWGYIDLKGMPDAPAMGETEGEIKQYFKLVCGGNEFRENDEIHFRFFKNNCDVNDAAVDAATDVYELITPSKERALELNKAYRVIVEQQGFIYGRDATVKPVDNVFKEIDSEQEPLEKEHRRSRDIRLDW